MTAMAEPWNGLEIAVTGGNGVLGRRLIRQLVGRGIRRVVVVSRKGAHLDVLAETDFLIENVTANILSPGEYVRAIEGCNVLFHLAALTDAGQSRLEPELYWTTNVSGTVQVMEACRRAGVRHVIYTSTSHIYGVPRRSPVDEEHPTCPLSVYAASKLAGETVLQGYVAGFGLGATVVRMTNIYGGNLGANTVIGLAIAQAAAGGPIRLRSLSPVRDFIYVDDAIEALIRLGELLPAPAVCRVVNAGSGLGTSIREMADILTRVSERLGMSRIKIDAPQDSAADSVPSFIVDPQRLRALTGWSPSIGLAEGLALALTDQRNRTII